MIYNLTLAQSLPFAQNPAICEIEGDKIVCNGVALPADIDAASRYNPCHIHMYVIGHVFGAVCAVFARHEQDALDDAVDAGMMDAFMAENQDRDDESLTALGNASELFNLSDMWIGTVKFDPARDILLITALVRAAESGADTLE